MGIHVPQHVFAPERLTGHAAPFEWLRPANQVVIVARLDEGRSHHQLVVQLDGDGRPLQRPGHPRQVVVTRGDGGAARPEPAARQDVERTSGVGLADEQVDVAHRPEPWIGVHQVRERGPLQDEEWHAPPAPSRRRRRRRPGPGLPPRARAASASPGGEHGDRPESPGLPARCARARAAPCRAVPPRSRARRTTGQPTAQTGAVVRPPPIPAAAHTATRTGTRRQTASPSTTKSSPNRWRALTPCSCRTAVAPGAANDEPPPPPPPPRRLDFHRHRRRRRSSRRPRRRRQ